MSPRKIEDGRWLLDIAGTGFSSGCVVHVARWTAEREWHYFAAELAVAATPTLLTIPIGELPGGEYALVIRDFEGLTSGAIRFALNSGKAYVIPVGPDERWVMTQGPNGTFSHRNRSRNARDIVPIQGRYVVAMRAGTAHTHDLGLGQTPHLRSFGNYITIDHDDGEYSHYAHLATGSFMVRDGERVEQGRRLARVGNSGYALGARGGYHVHVHVTRSPAIGAQSIPFEFSAERQPQVDGPARQSGSVQVAQWWTDGVTVPPKTTYLRLRVRQATADTGVALHVLSPGGTHYAAGALEFHRAYPEPGVWRIEIEGMRGGPEPIAFELERGLYKAKAPSDETRGFVD